MRNKATTTGLQATERERDTERRRDPERRRLIEEGKNILVVLLLASSADTKRNRLPYLTLYNSATFSHPGQPKTSRRERAGQRSCACTSLPVGRQHAHALSTMHTHTRELRLSVMSPALSLWWLQ